MDPPYRVVPAAATGDDAPHRDAGAQVEIGTKD